MFTYKTLFKWQEPREATRWRDADVSARRSRFAGAAEAVASAAGLMLLWWVSRNPQKPSLEAALLLAAPSGVFFAYGIPMLVRLVRPTVFVRDNGICAARANTAVNQRYRDVSSVEIGILPDGPDVPFLTVRLHNGRVHRYGIAPEVDLAKVAAAIEGRGVAVRFDLEEAVA
jgi:hypothetical protein